MTRKQHPSPLPPVQHFFQFKQLIDQANSKTLQDFFSSGSTHYLRPNIKEKTVKNTLYFGFYTDEWLKSALNFRQYHLIDQWLEIMHRRQDPLIAVLSREPLSLSRMGYHSSCLFDFKPERIPTFLIQHPNFLSYYKDYCVKHGEIEKFMDFFLVGLCQRWFSDPDVKKIYGSLGKQEQSDVTALSFVLPYPSIELEYITKDLKEIPALSDIHFIEKYINIQRTIQGTSISFIPGITGLGHSYDGLHSRGAQEISSFLRRHLISDEKFILRWQELKQNHPDLMINPGTLSRLGMVKSLEHIFLSSKNMATFSCPIDFNSVPSVFWHHHYWQDKQDISGKELMESIERWIDMGLPILPSSKHYQSKKTAQTFSVLGILFEWISASTAGGIIPYLNQQTKYKIETAIVQLLTTRCSPSAQKHLDHFVYPYGRERAPMFLSREHLDEIEQSWKSHKEYKELTQMTKTEIKKRAKQERQQLKELRATQFASKNQEGHANQEKDLPASPDDEGLPFVLLKKKRKL